MALTHSQMLPLGTFAPSFELEDVISRELVSLQRLKSPVATVIMFICNHCPYVKHVQVELVKLAKTYQPKGVTFIAINSNDTQNYPDDSPEKMRETAINLDYTFPYLIDTTQEIAKAYSAVCTPDFYIFDGELKCVYRGQLDDSRPGNNIPVTGKDIRAALESIISKQPVSPDQKPSVGCNIKWKT